LPKSATAHREDLTAKVLIAVIKARALACKPFIEAQVRLWLQ
jgi:hypothetical protein